MGERLFNIEVEKEPTHLYIRVTGEISQVTAREINERVRDASVEYDCHQLLVDMRDTRHEMNLADLFELGVFIRVTGRGLNNRNAMVLKPDNIRPDRFFETVLRNRGIDFRVFSDIDEARAWLIAGREPCK